MFKIAQSQTYKWPVSFQTPTDGQKYETQTFDAEFKRIPQSRLQEIAKAGDAITSEDVVREVLVGWKGILDDSGEVPFSVSALENLLEVPLLTSAIVNAFFDSISGAAKRKN